MNGCSAAMPSSDHLIWIDLEMTGLKPDTDFIDANLKELLAS